MFAVSAYIYATRNFAPETGISLAGVSRAGLQCYCRTLGLRGPDLARGPEVVRPWSIGIKSIKCLEKRDRNEKPQIDPRGHHVRVATPKRRADWPVASSHDVMTSSIRCKMNL